MKDLYSRVLMGVLQLKLRLKMRFYYFLDLEDLVELKYGQNIPVGLNFYVSF